jgi:DNA-binding transcriptional LysR family regulator
LKVFVDLAESQSFSEAASRNGISQPAVSQQIGCLEEAFSTPLVERSRRRFRLTPAGEALFQTAREVLQSVESLKGRLAKLDANVSGRLQVVTTANLAIEFIPRLNSGLRVRHPDIVLDVVYQPVSRIYADVAGNVADFGVVACPRDDARFDYLTMVEETLVFVAVPGSGLRERSLKENLRQFVAYSPDQSTAALIAKTLQDCGIHAPVALEFEHPETVKKALHATNGFSCLPEDQIAAELASGQLVRVKGLTETVSRKICAVFSKQRQSHPGLRVIQEFLQASNAVSEAGRDVKAAVPVPANSKPAKRSRAAVALGL